MNHIVFPILTAILFTAVYAWAVSALPWCGRNRRRTAGILVALFVGELVARRIEMHWHVASPVAVAGEVIVMTLVLTALPLGIIRVVSDLVQYLQRALRRAPAAEPPVPAAPEGMTRRQMVEAGAGLVLIGGTGSMIGWGMVRGRDAYQIDEVPLRIQGLPKALDGYVILQISDIHTGDHVGERMLDEGLDRVRQAKGDLLVVTGDMVDNDAAYAPLFARKVMSVAPRDGVFGCLGNHDYYAKADKVTEAMRAAGVRMLVNDGLVIRPADGGGFALLGVDDVWSHRYRRDGARLDLALAKVPDGVPRVLLSHQPPTVEAWAGKVALQLSGHTHGGQINPLGLRPADMFFEYVSGLYRVSGTQLYVNRGFGTVGPPARVNAPPEVTRLVLVAA
jgi:predicted MPP superfamily phosphohydrolase